MNNENLDKYLILVNGELQKREIEGYIPLYPMLRMLESKLYIAVMVTKETDNVWDFEGSVKADYWVLINPLNDEIEEFNTTKEKDFVIGNLIEKDRISKQKEISKYSVTKAIEYKNYLLNDIRNEQLPIQKKLADFMNDEFLIDGEKVDINDYIIANLEDEIKQKIDDLVNLLVLSKYGTITFYYDQLFNSIIKEYEDDSSINIDKMKLCIEIMNNYYDGVIAIDNMFNVFLKNYKQ